jgi:hypothetical protein
MSTPVAVPVTSAAQTNQVQFRHEAAQARATWRMTNAIGAANEDKAARAAAVTSPSDALGSLAIATTVAAMMTTMPAALHLMAHAAHLPGRDKPDGAARSISQDAYDQVTQRVASPGGSTGTGMQAGSSSTGQRGGSSSGDAFASDADGAEAAQVAADMARIEPQLSSAAPFAMANANLVAGSAVAAVAARTGNGPGTRALQVVEDAPSASPSTLTGIGVRQAIALFKQNATAIRNPMPVVALVA